MTLERLRLTRKAAAPVLIGLALFLVWVGASRLATTLADGPLAELHAARERRAELVAIAERAPRAAPALLANGETQRATDRAAALRALTAKLRVTGARAGVLVERVEPVPAGGLPKPLVAIRVVASGSEKALFTFVGDIERARPMIRFAAWRLGRIGTLDATSRLDARAVVVTDTGP